ncbi:MAG: glutamate--tRNA ligase [Promethearchaeota archaeon]|jgi:glutamyl-tRNA synthetase
MEPDKLKKLIWIYGLKNAIKFGGKPNSKAVLGKLLSTQKDLRSQVATITSLVNEILTMISDMPTKKQQEKLLELDPSGLDKEETLIEKKELPVLPNVEKHEKIVMRFSPYPSGALHIGNARTVILNNEYIKKYNGELILIFDDTIGSPKALRDSPKAKYVLPESYGLIEDGLKWLDIEYSNVYYKSDRLNLYYDYCEKLICDSMAYVCFCSADIFRNKYKNQKKDCPHRNQTMKQNLEEWKKMLAKEYHEREAVVRLKSGMEQKDPAIRDHIIMRISEADHPRVGDKYSVWPMLEFSMAIDDCLIGVTHILRGADLIKEDIIEEFIWNHFNWDKADFLHNGRLRFPNMKLSKTLSRNNIQNGTYEGWDDPRTWSLQSLRKRGIEPEALKETLLDLGMSIAGITFDIKWLYSKNRDLIDSKSDRYFYVEDPVLIEIKDIPFSTYEAKPLILPSTPEKGHRIITVKAKDKVLKIFISLKDAIQYNKNQIIRLKDLINIEILSIDKKNRTIKARFHSYELNRYLRR